MARSGADEATVEQFDVVLENLRDALNRLTDIYRDICRNVDIPGMPQTEFE